MLFVPIVEYLSWFQLQALDYVDLNFHSIFTGLIRYNLRSEPVVFH